MTTCHLRVVILAQVWKGHLELGQDGAQERGFSEWGLENIFFIVILGTC